MASENAADYLARASVVDGLVQLDTARARTGDPWTSHAAAGRIYGKKRRRSQDAVYEALVLWGPLHDEAMQERYYAEYEQHGWPKQKGSGPRSRRSELEKMGRVRNTGRTFPLPGGKDHAIIWEAVPVGEQT